MKESKILLLFFLGIYHFSFSQNQYSDAASTKGIEHTYGVGVAGGGVSFADFTGDGLDDLTLATANGQTIQFYKNVNGIFEAIPPLVPETSETKQILWVDYDNDGDKDLFTSSLDGTNRLYQNDGNLNLTDVTAASGFPMTSFESFGACWGDVNRDGWLDVYITKRSIFFDTNQAWLYLNNGDGTFSDITTSSGTIDEDKAAFMPVFVDINNDLWQDIYIAHDKTKINTLLKNNGDLTFSDISESSNANIQINAMCVASGDYDNDGDLDLYVSNTPDGNKLLHNLGNETFEEVADVSGVGFYGIGWGSNFLDVENDGDLDLYASGMVVGTDLISSALYENVGAGSFEEMLFVGDTVSSFANAIGDFNDDGLPDIAVNNTAPFQSHLWENQTTTDNNYLKIKLTGVISNRDGIGSWIRVFVDGEMQVRYTHCGIGYLGQNSETEIIGVGEATSIDSIQITWLTGHVDRLYDVAVNQKLIIEEGSTTNGDIYIDPVLIDNPVSLKSLEKTKTEISILPNPSQGIATLRSQFGAMSKIQIFNQSGSILLEQNFSTPQTISELILDLPAGIYFVKVEDEKERIEFLKWSVM